MLTVRIITFLLISALYIEMIYYAFQLQNVANDAAVFAGTLLFILASLFFAAYVNSTIITPLRKHFDL